MAGGGVLALVVMFMHAAGNREGIRPQRRIRPPLRIPLAAETRGAIRMPGAKIVAPAPKSTPASRKTTTPAAGNADVDPIVGCYQWFNNSPVVIRADGTMIAGPFTGHWRLVDAQRRAYTFTWPMMIETLTVSPDQRTMSGGNQYGYPISGSRVAGSTGLAGTWQWANGWTVVVLRMERSRAGRSAERGARWMRRGDYTR